MNALETWHVAQQLCLRFQCMQCCVEAFVQWLTATFRPELVRLQAEADAVSRYICGFYPGSSSLLNRSLEALGIDRASTAPESRRLLHEMHRRMLLDKAGLADGTAEQQPHQQQQTALLLAPDLTTSVYVPPPRVYAGVELLLKMYSEATLGSVSSR